MSDRENVPLENRDEIASPEADNDNAIDESATIPKAVERLVAQHIPLHKIIVKEMADSYFVLQMESGEDFHDLVQAIVDEMGANTLGKQEIALERARKVFKGWRFEGWPRRLIDLEMRSAAVAIQRRTLETGLEKDPVADQKAVQLANKTHLQNCVFDQDQLEWDGYGLFPIETEAVKRALRNLELVERLITANQRAKNFTMKQYKEIERFDGERARNGE
jgi:hypothetical protein